MDPFLHCDQLIAGGGGGRGGRKDLVALLSFDSVACAFSIVVCVESFVGYDFCIVAFSEQHLYCL